MREGKPLGMFAHRRVRERPPSGGVSVLRESIALPKDMVEATLKLLRRVNGTVWRWWNSRWMHQ